MVITYSSAENSSFNANKSVNLIGTRTEKTSKLSNCFENLDSLTISERTANSEYQQFINNKDQSNSSDQLENQKNNDVNQIEESHV